MAEKEKVSIDEVYGIDRDALAALASKNLMSDRQYKKLYDEYQRLDRRRDFVKIGIVQSRLRLMESREMDRLTELEIARRKDVNRLADLLKEKDTLEYEQYQDLMSALSLLLDMMDSTFGDLNRLLVRNKIGITMEQFPELLNAKQLAWQMATGEQDKMPEYKGELWSGESERIYKYLLDRCATYRRKVDRIEAKMEKNHNN